MASLLGVLSSPLGALSLAVAVLAAALGVRLLASHGVPGLASAVAYVASLAVTWLGGHALVPGGAPPGSSPPTIFRLAGAALLVVGLVSAARAARRPDSQKRVLAGLGLVLAGQILRAPSPAGLAALAAAAAVLGWAGLLARRAR
jgi:hypothetical protein